MATNIATILPPARTVFFDVNANPLSGGFVFMYVPPNTTTFKTTWQDAGETIPNTNPIILDSNGSCLLYGSGQYLQEVYDSNMNLVFTGLTQDLYELIVTSPALITVPIGGIVPYAGTTAPTNWQLCYGQSLVTTSFSQLFNIIGYIYGGSGLSFNLPDLRGRLPAGVDNMGGSAAGRITTPDGSLNGVILGSAGGNQATQLHTHTASTTVTDPGHFHTVRGGGGGTSGGPNANAYDSTNPPIPTTTSTTGISVSVSNTNYGLGNSQNVQPTMMLNYIIFAGTS